MTFIVWKRPLEHHEKSASSGLFCFALLLPGLFSFAFWISLGYAKLSYLASGQLVASTNRSFGPVLKQSFSEGSSSLPLSSFEQDEDAYEKVPWVIAWPAFINLSIFPFCLSIYLFIYLSVVELFSGPSLRVFKCYSLGLGHCYYLGQVRFHIWLKWF